MSMRATFSHVTTNPATGRPDRLRRIAGSIANTPNPATGRILWSTPHDPGNDLNCSTPLWGPDNILFVSSAYRAGSRAIQ